MIIEADLLDRNRVEPHAAAILVVPWRLTADPKDEPVVLRYPIDNSAEAGVYSF